MADKIEITSDCDGLASAHPDSEKLCGIEAGSVLLLLRDEDRDYYKVAFGGQPLFVPKSCGVCVESGEAKEQGISVREPEPEREAPKSQEIGPRTVREFTASSAIWPIVDAWAVASRYHLAESWESTRLYQSHGGFVGKYIGSEWKLTISQTGSKVRMEAWVPRMWLQMLAGGLYMFGLLMPPAEQAIESGAARGGSPRARTRINELLHRLGQPPIE